jgi:hypothetical protein
LSFFAPKATTFWRAIENGAKMARKRARETGKGPPYLFGDDCIKVMAIDRVVVLLGRGVAFERVAEGVLARRAHLEQVTVQF